MAALKGDWKSIEDMPCIQRRISKSSTWETTLHIAAAANKEDFVKKLLSWMENNPTTRTGEDVSGATRTGDRTGEDVSGATRTAEDVSGPTRTAEDVSEIRNSALILAATVGNVNIAQEILKPYRMQLKVKPLFMASFSGHSQMVEFLYPYTNFVGNEKADIFINCVKNDLYGKHK